MISVIVPMYNAEKYIIDCLKSLENQAYKDFETILVNDGSTDGTLQVVEHFKQASSMRITVITQENGGVSKARNTGIANAAGEYICFVDSDDVVLPQYLEFMYSEINKKNCQVCICGKQYTDETLSSRKSLSHEYKVKSFTKTEALSELLYRNFDTGIGSILVKRDTMGQMRFAEGFKYSEDLHFIWRMAAVSENIVYIDYPLYIYRMRSTSVMSSFDERRLDGKILFEKLELFIRENAPGFSDTFNKYGVARWVWSAIWQEAVFAGGYAEFCSQTEKYQPVLYMRKLLSFPDIRICLSSLVFVSFRRLYYIAMRTAMRNYRIKRIG